MNILVRGTNWIGDAVMTIPAIRKLRRLFPDARITLQTREATAGIFRDSGLFDEIVTPLSFFDQLRTLRQRRFDLAVIFPNSLGSATVAWLGGAKRRFGYAAEGRSLLLSDPVAVPPWKETRHEVYYYLELVDAVENAYFDRVQESGELEPSIAIAADRQGKLRGVIQDLGFEAGRPIVVIAPGSTNSRAKRWMPESFARVNDRLQTELGAAVVLMGSESDKEVSNRVVELSRLKPVDLTGKTDISGAAEFLSDADLLISNDMGLAHLAPAVGTKTIVIFGPTNPVTTRPFSDKASIIRAGVECSPCMLRDCPIDHRCMTRVSADDVFEQARALLASPEMRSA